MTAPRTPADLSPAAHERRLTIAERIRLWREDAAALRRYGYVQVAEVLEHVTTELEANQAGEEPGELVDLRRAAVLSGYTRGHLRRMLLEGRLPNHGTGRKPLLRTSDLPRKARGNPAKEEPCGGVGEGLLSRSQVARAIVRGD